MSIILYPEDRIDLREVILKELHRQYARGFLIPHSRDDGSMELFFADDLVKEIETYFDRWEEELPECPRRHCDDTDDTDRCGGTTPGNAKDVLLAVNVERIG